MIKTTGEILRKRKLERSYLVLYCMHAKLYSEDEKIGIDTKKLYVFFGCTLDGTKKYVSSVYEEEVEKTSGWYNYFQELKKRGIEHMVYALLPEIRELKDAIKLSFPKVETYISCSKTIEKLKKYTSYKTKDEIYRVVRKLYLAKDITEYEINYKDFESKYSKYPFIMNMLEKELKEIRKNYKYSSEIRRIIYAFNYIIEMEKRFVKMCNEKMYKTKEEFINDCAVFIERSELSMHYTKTEWVEVINEIYEEKKELIEPYL